MGFIDNFFGRSTRLREAQVVLNSRANMQNEVHALEVEVAQLRESYTGLASLRLEDYGWSPVDGWSRSDGFDIRRLQEEADTCRQLYAINPLIKKAVLTRIGLIHGRGNRVVSIDESAQAKVDAVLEVQRRKIFGKVARANLETELSTAGNVFVVSEGTAEAVIVPLRQIVGYISEVEDPTRVLYWKRNYTAQRTNLDTDQEETVEVTEYIPTTLVSAPRQNIGTVPVRTRARMHHIAANRQEGWVLGLPDLFAAKFWTRGHKEMFEAGHEFALAQGEIAAVVKAGKGMGSQLPSTRLADEPRRDPDTGEVYGYGGTAVIGNGMEYQLMNKMGSGVDFTSYDRIAGLIAVATGVPLSVLLGESDSEESSLEQSVIDDMKMRQELWGEFYEDFFGATKVRVVWPRIKQETVYRVNQSIEISSRSNTLKAEEKRLLTLEAYGLEGDASEVPDINEHPDVQVYLAKKKIDLEYAPLIAAAEASAAPDEDADTKRSTVNDQGNDQKLGKLSDGEDAHDARDNGEQEHTR